MTGFPSRRLDREPPLIRYRPPRPAASRLRLLTELDMDRGRDTVRAVETGRQAAQRPVRAPGLDREMRGFIRLVIACCVVVLLAIFGAVVLACWLGNIIWDHRTGTEQVLFWSAAFGITGAVFCWVERAKR